MIKTLTIALVLTFTLLLSVESSAQEQESIHAAHADVALGSKDGRAGGGASPSRADSCALSHTVFGWHPYWLEDSYEGHDFSLLSDVSYFSYEVDVQTGGYKDIHKWRTTKLVDYAKASGTRVNLCVTLFSDHATLFGNEKAVSTLIDSLVSLVKLREAHGVNIDFEGVAASQRENLSRFMLRLADRFHREIEGSQVSMALPAVDWRDAYDVETMAAGVDLFIIMGYGYHWASSTHAGPVAPRNNGDRWSPIDLTRSIDTYLKRGVPKQKLALGLPWYGFNWPTHSGDIAAPTAARGSSRTYRSVHESFGLDSARWDSASSTPWFATHVQDSLWQQLWFDDARSLEIKYELAVMKGLAGVGIWALGYDGGHREMWDALHRVFGDCNETACSGELFDMGGPGGPYHPDEEWTYTIAPEGATSIEIALDSYNIANDHLYLFAGYDTDARLIEEITGSGGPKRVTTTTPAITVRFVSGGSDEGEGFLLWWKCSYRPLSIQEPRGPFSLFLR